jgi:hypothetical protein
LPEGFCGGAEPVVVDLMQYANRALGGLPVAHSLLLMTSDSLDANGALQTSTAKFDDSALFDALSTTQQVVIVLDLSDVSGIVYRFTPTASVFGPDGEASLYSFSALLTQNTMIYELKAFFYFLNDTGTEMEISVQAKPVIQP